MHQHPITALFIETGALLTYLVSEVLMIDRNFFCMLFGAVYHCMALSVFSEITARECNLWLFYYVLLIACHFVQQCSRCSLFSMVNYCFMLIFENFCSTLHKS